MCVLGCMWVLGQSRVVSAVDGSCSSVPPTTLQCLLDCQHSAASAALALLLVYKHHALCLALLLFRSGSPPCPATGAAARTPQTC